MKRIIGFIAGALTAAVIAGVCFLARSETLAIAACVTCIALLGCALGFAVKEEKIQSFLIRENRELQSKARDGERLMEAESKRMQSELSALQFQINPHFLYNTLDTIRAHALLNDQDQIAQMTEKLSRFFRYAISNRQPLVRLEDEIRHVQDYLYIQKERFGDRFETEIEMESPELGELYVLKLILQPLVENAITHGLEKLRRPGKIRMEAMATQHALVIHVADNGSGMPREKLTEMNDSLRQGTDILPRSRGGGRHNGIAVHNVNARIRLAFGPEYGIHYRSMEGEGTTAIITLPLIDDFARGRFEKAPEEK